IIKYEKDNYRWNYVEDKKYPANETRAQFVTRFKKVNSFDSYLDNEQEKHLWHIVYSVKDKQEFKTALGRFATRNNIDKASFVKSFEKMPPYSNDYGSYSEKAIKKLLPLMRIGHHWNEHNIHKETLKRIDKILTGEYDESIRDRVRQKSMHFEDIADFKGLPIWLVCYIVYDRHSESADNTKWRTPQDIDKYLNEFKQHSLRNPIVEQVVTETLRTVRDIWSTYGNDATNFFDEIHVELGRDMKNPAKKREQISKKNTENENTNIRIREILKEFMNDDGISDDIRPFSPSQQEALKIYEEGILQNPDAKYSTISEDEIVKIRKNASPSASDIKRYKLWLEQGYLSPYTGAIIPLSKLFSTEYQIEHIIPQARFFDDSLSNKIICESEVNELKSSQTAFEFLKKERGRKVELSGGRTVELLNIEGYEAHCNRYFKNNRPKLKKLMSEEIPEGFIERQMNDSRYISKLVKSLLNNIVRDEDEKGSISHKVVPVTGVITSKLKRDWGLNDKWNKIVAPRFKRLNEMTNSNHFGYYDNGINAFRCEVPDELKRGFNKKRIDHRHHALDALVIACTTREHINYLSSLNSERTNYALRDSLLIKSKKGDHTKVMLMPWKNFPNEALDNLKGIIISFKQNTRVINKTNNKTWQWREERGTWKKKLVKQTEGDNWAIRKPMHKETVSGAVQVRKIKEVSFANGIKDWQNLLDKDLKKLIKILLDNGLDIKKIATHFKKEPYLRNGKEATQLLVYYFTENAAATRISLSDKFTRKQLESITDSGIQTILENHIKSYIDQKGKECFDIAFSPDGIEVMNKNISQLNNNKKHQPIYKVRIYEEGSKFNIGAKGNKAAKFVEAAKGTNLFFAIYWNEDKQKREYETVPLNLVIEHQKQVAHLPKEERTPIPVNHQKGRFLFALSPNDLVYIPTEEEIDNPNLVDFEKLSNEQLERIYKMVSTTKGECHFVPNSTAFEIAKNENGTNSKSERLQDFYQDNCIYDLKGKPIMIKSKCWKLKVDRLGKITGVER
nr:type II CRISPR RNA-guided endonuclease Cas9 [Bacteroidales bacterium]